MKTILIYLSFIAISYHTYAKAPVDSDLIMPEHTISQSDYMVDINNTDLGSINKNNIQKLSAETFYQMLQNSSNISQERIIYLWKLITSNHVDSKVKVLFYDFISFENPNYLTSEIIKQAKDEKGEARHKLLITLQSIYQDSLQKNVKTNLKEIINYFDELQHQDLNKNDGGIIYRGLAILAPNKLNPTKANLTNMDKIHVDILSLKNNRAKERKYVHDIINNLDNPDDTLVVTATYQYLTELLIQSDLHFFSQESKQLFKKHLENKKMDNLKQPLVYTSAYIEFKAALNANKCEEIPLLANEYLQLLRPEIQESTFNGFSDFTKQIK